MQPEHPRGSRRTGGQLLSQPWLHCDHHTAVFRPPRTANIVPGHSSDTLSSPGLHSEHQRSQIALPKREISAPLDAYEACKLCTLLSQPILGPQLSPSRFRDEAAAQPTRSASDDSTGRPDRLRCPGGLRRARRRIRLYGHFREFDSPSHAERRCSRVKTGTTTLPHLRTRFQRPWTPTKRLSSGLDAYSHLGPLSSRFLESAATQRPPSGFPWMKGLCAPRPDAYSRREERVRAESVLTASP